MKRDHTYISLINTIHHFQLKSKRKRIGVRGSYHVYKCSRCGISGFRYGNSMIITISKQYGQERYSKCNIMSRQFTDVAGMYIKLQPINIPLADCSQWPTQSYHTRDSSLFVGSIHKVINTNDLNKKNNARGAWIMGKLEPIKIFNSEFKFIVRKSRRTKFNKKKKLKRRSSRTL